MDPSSSQPFDTKPTQPPLLSRGPQVLGVALIVLFVVWIVSGIVPQFRYLLLEDHQGRNVWIEDILPSHLYWGVIVCSLLSGIGLLGRKAWAYGMAIAISITWLGMQSYYFFYMVLTDAATVLEAMVSLSGLRFPPTFNSLAILVINSTLFAVLLVGSGEGMRTALGVWRDRFLKAVAVGVLTVAYGVTCHLVSKALSPDEFVYFEF